MKRLILLLLCIVTSMFALPSYATPYNIAVKAKVSASSAVEGFMPGNIIDGKIRQLNQGEWRSTSQISFYGSIDYPWIQLDWDDEQYVERVVLYDRPDTKSHIAGVTLHFSDGSEVYVNSIDNNGAARVVDFPARRTRFIRIECTDADGINAGLSEVEAYPALTDDNACIEKVNPYIETARGRYFFFATGSRPFGMISAAPLTRNKNQYGGGYNYNSKEVLGFPQLHDWMNGGIVLMPTTGEVETSGGEQSWKSPFVHEGEIVRPGYHRLFLERYNLWVEQTATDRVGMYRFTYCEDAPQADVLLNLGGYCGTVTMTDARVNRVNNREIEGSVNSMGRLWGGPKNVKIYYVMQFDRPFTRLDAWDDQQILTGIDSLRARNGKPVPRVEGMTYWDGPSAGVRARFSAKNGEQIQVKIAVSYTSIENARLNLESDCNHWDFDTVHQDAEREWDEQLSRITVKGGSTKQQVKFYTDLWHVLLGRHKIDDFSGDYPDYTQGVREGSHTDAVYRLRTLPRGKDGKVKYHMYNSDAFWLTQWNLNILWGLAWPEVLDDFAASLVQYAHNGKLLPRGPNLGGYSYIMTACPATPLITCAYQKGMLTKVDAGDAYRVMVDNHRKPGMLGSKEELADYERLGYYPGSAGFTIEAAFQDWALGQMALKMGKKRDAAYFDKRSHGWQSLYCPQVGLILPKKANGEWVHQNTLSGEGWIEANAWQATWSLSHDLGRLASLMGGNDSLCSKLNFAFEQSRRHHFVFGYGAGYVSYANQPGCSNAHVFNRAGHPELAQYWVRRVNEQAYGATIPDMGYGGHDEDQGQMAAVSALMSLGLFSVDGTCSTDPVYDITSPVFDEICIRLHPDYYPEAKTFTIRCHNNSDENCYIQKATYNGQPLNDFLLPHVDFARGGLLELSMGNTAVR